MERNEAKGSDSIVYMIASMGIIALLACIASRSVIVLHRIELPALSFQANLYSHIFAGPEYDAELSRMQKITNVLNTEFAKKDNYSTIRTSVLRDIVRSSSVHTRNRTCVLSSALLGLFGLLITGTTMKTRRRLYQTRNDIRSLRKRGVEGFIRLVGQHLSPDSAESVKRSPDPENLARAFEEVREKVNIPCSVVARLFPRNSKERMALLAYGKSRVTFAEAPQGSPATSEGG